MLALTELDGMYHLDPAHSSIAFVARHAGIAKVRGTFESFHGWALIDGAQPEHSALLVSVKVSSINSRDANRDGHLRSPDFFDVARFPAITFVGTDFRITGENLVEVDGNLTVRDVTNPVTFDVTVTPASESEISGVGVATVNYPDFGLAIPEVPSVTGVEDEVRLEIEFRAVAG